MNFKNQFIVVLTIMFSSGLVAQIVDNDFKNNQPKDNSPLSRIGLGNLTPTFLSSNAGMGGISAAYRDPFIYNPFNPASLPTLRTTAYEIGINVRRNNITEGKNTASAWGGNLSHLAIGFPTYSVINEVLDRKARTLRWGMGLSLMPFNNVAYSVSTTQKAPGIDTANITNYYFGSGGSYRLMWGNGIAYKGFSAGVNIGYLFGKMNYIRQSEFTNVTIPYDNYFDDNYTLRGFTWNMGLQYDYTLDPTKSVTERGNRKHIIIGVYGNQATNFNVNQNLYYRRAVSGTAVTDTLAYATDKSGSGRLPTEITVGLAYENSLLFRIGAEYKFSKWSQYRNDARPQDVLNDASYIAVGSEFILDKSRLKTEEEKIRWRLGVRFGKDGRVLNGEQLSIWATSAGMCLPMRVGRGAQISYLNLGLEFGKQGTPSLSEQYLKLNLGFTLNDNSWFLKRKFQ